jgi:hypothetical protein
MGKLIYYLYLAISMAFCIAFFWVLVTRLGRRHAAKRGTPPSLRRDVRYLLIFSGVFICGLLLMNEALDFSARRSDLFPVASQTVKESRTANQMLGNDIEMGWPIKFTFHGSGADEDQAMEIPVSGSRAKGTLVISGTKAEGRWKVEQLYLRKNPTGELVELQLHDQTAAQ